MINNKYINLLSKLTLEEKIDMLTGVDFNNAYKVPRLNIPALTLHDSPFGVRWVKNAKRPKQKTVFLNTDNSTEYQSTAAPCACASAATFNTQIVEKLGEALGEECVALGCDVLLGPGVNIKRHPLCGRNFEYFSEDPILAGKLAAAYITGLQSKGVAASLKHFALNNQERGRQGISSEIDERTFRELYLKPFEIAVKESHPDTVMNSYNRINGIYASENDKLINKILIGEWGFDGVVVSDWGGVKNRAVSLKAGTDLAMPDNDNFHNDIKKALDDGYITEKDIDRSVKKILELIDKTRHEKCDDMHFEDHYNTMYNVSAESMTLLKNRNNTLPLKRDEIKKLLIIGNPAIKPLIGGDGSSRIKNPPKIAIPADEIASRVSKDCEIRIMASEEIDPTDSDIGYIEGKIGINAEWADAAIIFMAQSNSSNSEALDRNSYEFDPITEHYVRLVHNAGCKKVICVLNIGGSIKTKGFECYTDAILVSWLGGEAMGEAIADTIFGIVNPSGRLPETFSEELYDHESMKYYSYDYKRTVHKEGLNVGYRGFETNKIIPQYPFGYGLSYTKFAYDKLNITVKDNTYYISVSVTNIGEIEGKEVVQLYVSPPESTLVSRPKKELKAFAKVTLKPGETKKAEMIVPRHYLEFYDILSSDYMCDRGEHTFIIASDCITPILSEKVFVDEPKTKYFTL